MNLFNTIRDSNPTKDSPFTIGYIAIIKSSEGQAGVAGGQQNINQEEEEQFFLNTQSSVADKLPYFNQIVQKSLTNGLVESGGYFSRTQNDFILYDEVGTQNTGVPIPLEDRQDAIWMVHSHPNDVAFTTSILPSKQGPNGEPGDLIIIKNDHDRGIFYDGYVVSLDGAGILYVVEYNTEGKISGIYDGATGNPTELKGFFQLWGVPLGDKSVDDFTDPQLINKARGQTPNIIVNPEGEFDEGGTGQGGKSGKAGYDIQLIDEYRNFYNISRVSFINEEFSGTEGVTNFPKPWVITEDGKVLQEGAKLCICFPSGRDNPVVMGCLRSAVGQEIQSNLRYNPNDLSQKITDVKRGECRLQIVEDDTGVHILVEKGGYVISAENSIGLISDSISIMSEDGIDLSGKYIQIGGTTGKSEAEDQFRNKSKEVGVYADKVILGYTNIKGQHEPLEEDEEGEIEDPKLQPTIMGTSWKYLMEKLADILKNMIIITPQGPGRLSDQDVMRITQEFEGKLDKPISSVAFIVKDKEVMGEPSE